jgi:hypothetical protein
MVKVPVEMGLLGAPGASAMAFSVVVRSTLTGPEQMGEASVGVLPSVVQRTTALGVELVIVTCCGLVKVPASGLNRGAAAGEGGGGFGAGVATFGGAHESGVQGIGHGMQTGWKAVGVPAGLGVEAQPSMARTRTLEPSITRFIHTAPMWRGRAR